MKILALLLALGAAPAAAGEEVRPVYPPGERQVPPLALELCGAIHGVPAARRATCCGKSPGVDLTGLCAGALSASVGSRSAALVPETVRRCARAIAETHQGCAWVGPWSLPLPAECQSVVVGKVPEGKRCRSSLECRGRLHCRGAGPTSSGLCLPAEPAGGACGVSVDVLHAYIPLEVERSHPECRGSCERRRCVQAVLAGGACRSSARCADGLRCAAGACREGALGAAGEGCSGGDCQPGLRCLSGTCRVPAPAGAPCAADAECLGGCLPGDGGPRHCGMNCGTR